MQITNVHAAFEREPLVHPYGFKGGHLSELWQPVALLDGTDGRQALGLGTQSVLWSDPAVFAAHTESGGNVLMFAVLEFGLQLSRQTAWQHPSELLSAVLPQAYDYARRVTGRPDLRKTFVLNALVPLDNAAWMLHAGEGSSFEAVVPPECREALSHRHDSVASIPSAGYGTTVEELQALAEAGHFVIKVKLGHPGSVEDMLARDMERMTEVHDVFRDRETEQTASGRIPYYFDINGRYADLDTLRRLLDHAAGIGALERTLVVEEPFPEDFEADVSGLGVRLAADESAHTDADARKLMDMGYGAIALKPVAKTASMTFKIAAEAHERGVPCFCADLTVNPILVDWNKSFAARLAPLPGLEVGLLETNGHQYYRNWAAMAAHHPCAGASWTEARDGLFRLDEAFYEHSGGIFDMPIHYLDLVRPPA
jgi:L-alanine-DL-glutamate epimerase-like enolase superfamily enzyme